MNRALLVLAAAAFGFGGTVAGLRPAVAAEAARLTKYGGMHPVSPHVGAFCYIDVPHVHRVPPPDMRVYVVLAPDENVFVGDPVALGYDGPKYAYFGAHPLMITGLPPTRRIYCYLTGPHYHASPPSTGAHFVSKAGAYWYMGPTTPDFARESYRSWINQAGTIKNYRPPAVDITAAPAGYHPLPLPLPVSQESLAPVSTGKADSAPRARHARSPR